MGALGIARLAGVLSLAILPACAANTRETKNAEPLQLRPPTFNPSLRDLARARLAQFPQSANDAPAPAPADAPRIAERCATNDYMSGPKVEQELAVRTPILFLLVGRGSGGAVPMPNGCDPKVDSIRTRIGRN